MPAVSSQNWGENSLRLRTMRDAGEAFTEAEVYPRLQGRLEDRARPDDVGDIVVVLVRVTIGETPDAGIVALGGQLAPALSDYSRPTFSGLSSRRSRTPDLAASDAASLSSAWAADSASSRAR